VLSARVQGYRLCCVWGGRHQIVLAFSVARGENKELDGVTRRRKEISMHQNGGVVARRRRLSRCKNVLWSVLEEKRENEWNKRFKTCQIIVSATVYNIFTARRQFFLWIIREGERQRGDEEVFQHDRKSKVIQDSWTVCSAASKKTVNSGENENFDKTA
jgi:hypothetical protein